MWFLKTRVCFSTELPSELLKRTFKEDAEKEQENSSVLNRY
jgi:hypothetical protein